jgi:hypothetical protein
MFGADAEATGDAFRAHIKNIEQRALFFVQAAQARQSA